MYMYIYSRPGAPTAAGRPCPASCGARTFAWRPRRAASLGSIYRSLSLCLYIYIERERERYR